MFNIFRAKLIELNSFDSNININSDDEFNYTYIWWAIKNGDASQYYPTVVAKLTFMAIELDQVECGTKTGYILILDSNRFGLSHALRYSLSLAKNLMSYVQVNLI